VEFYYYLGPRSPGVLNMKFAIPLGKLFDYKKREVLVDLFVLLQSVGCLLGGCQSRVKLKEKHPEN
jgi:hypothetical protein